MGGQVASGEGIQGGPPPNFYTDLDFSNGLEHNGRSPPLPNYATDVFIAYEKSLLRVEKTVLVIVLFAIFQMHFILFQENSYKASCAVRNNVILIWGDLMVIQAVLCWNGSLSASRYYQVLVSFSFINIINIFKQLNGIIILHASKNGQLFSDCPELAIQLKRQRQNA